MFGQYQSHNPGHVLVDQEFLDSNPQLVKMLPPNIVMIPKRKAPSKPSKKTKEGKGSDK